MSTVEAMSAGCVPIVINAAGQKETVTKECGFRWNTPDELVRYTEDIAKDSNRLKQMSQAAKKRARQFEMDRFIERMSGILEKL